MRTPTGKPCGQCPFRRASLPGYLGADDPDNFLLTSLQHEEMPCHLTVNYERPDWLKRISRAVRCSGHAIFIANQHKLPRNPKVATLPRDTETVFQWPHEFRSHHKREASK